MAVIAYTIEQITPESIVCTWSGLHNSDTGQPLAIQGFALKNGYISGTKGTGGVLVLEASSSSQSPIWYSISSLETVPANFGSTAFIPSLFRPNVTAGDGSTNLILTAVFTNINTTI